MTAIKRVVSVAFWTDSKVVNLFSPEDKYFFLYLMTNPHTTQLGIYELNKRIAAFELGYSMDALSVLLDRFENKYGLIRYNPDTEEVAIKNYLKHSIVKGGKPVEDLLAKEICEVKDKRLLRFIYKSLSSVEDLNLSVKNILPLLIVNDNDNDNENEDSYPESYNESYDDSPKPDKKEKNKRFKPPTLDEVKAYCIERNNNINPEHFIDYYTSNGWKVGGRAAMKDWKAAVRNWEKREKPEKNVGANGIAIEKKPKTALDKELDEIWGN